jgi:hypothetical protein
MALKWQVAQVAGMERAVVVVRVQEMRKQVLLKKLVIIQKSTWLVKMVHCSVRSVVLI